MISGHASASVPALGLWGAIFFGVVLGVVGVRLLRGARPRALGALVLGLAILIPLTARALPFTFTNGTIADANQVNANFAALVPVQGFNTVIQQPPSQAIGSQFDILSPSFVAPRAMTCTINAHVSIELPVALSPSGSSVRFLMIKSENSVISLAFAPPQNGAVGSAFSITTNDTITSADFQSGIGPWESSSPAMFSVASGATVQFGARLQAFGSFTSANDTLLTIVYNCI
jgi:hypothetical protein